MRCRPVQIVPVVGDQAAQREPVKKAAAGEQHDQKDGEQEARDGVADDHDRAGPDIEARAVANGLANPERDRDQVGEQRGPEADRDRNRHLFHDQVDHALIAEVAGAEVELQILLQHLEEALVGGLVEAVQTLDLLDEFGIEALGAAVAGALAAARRSPATALHLAAAGPADARGRLDRPALDLRDQLLDRPARRRLHDHEVDHHDPEQGRDHQQHAADDIGEHASSSGSPPSLPRPRTRAARGPRA